MDTSNKNKLSIQRPKKQKQSKRKRNRSKGKKVTLKTIEFRPQAVPFARATKTINQGARQYQNGRDGIVVNHTELFDSLITDTTSPTGPGGDVIWYWTIQPAFKELFPYLSRLAKLYEFYRIRNVTFKFKTQSNAGTDGLVVMGYDLDPHDTTPTSDLAGRQTLMSMEGSVSGSVWQDLEMTVQSRHIKDRFSAYPKGLYVKSEGETASESRLSDFGIVYIGAFGTSATLKTLGDLYVSYEIELRVAQIHDAVPATHGQERPGESVITLATTVSETGEGGVKITEIPRTQAVGAPNEVTYSGPKLVELASVGSSNVYKSNFTGLRPMELEVNFGATTFYNTGFPNNTYIKRQFYNPTAAQWEDDVEQPGDPSTLAAWGTWFRTQLATFGDYGLTGKYIYRALVHFVANRVYRFIMNNGAQNYAACVVFTILLEMSRIAQTVPTLIPAGTSDGIPNYVWSNASFIPVIANSASSSSSESEKPASHRGTKESQGHREAIPGGLKDTKVIPH